SLGDQLLRDKFNEKVAQWTAIHIAATARALLSAENDPKTRLSLLHQLCLDINRLRRSDLHAERINIERLWLDLETVKAKQKSDDEFWAWTKRPDIAEKLTPPVTKGITPETLRQIEDGLCLMDVDDDIGSKNIGRLMRERRLRREAEEAEAMNESSGADYDGDSDSESSVVAAEATRPDLAAEVTR